MGLQNRPLTLIASNFSFQGSSELACLSIYPNTQVLMRGEVRIINVLRANCVLQSYNCELTGSTTLLLQI